MTKTAESLLDKTESELRQKKQLEETIKLQSIQQKDLQLRKLQT